MLDVALQGLGQVFLPGHFLVLFIGVFMGIIFGALVGFVVTSLLEWTYYLSPFWVVLGVTVSAGTGILAGMYPAWRAARVDPIVALRYE